MTRHGRLRRFKKSIAAVLLGGCVFQLGACDPAVRGILLTGLESTSSTLLQTFASAFFASLAGDDDSGSGSGLTTTP